MFLQSTKIVFLLVFLAVGCGDKKPNGNNPPTLTYVGMDQDSMVQGFIGDSIIVFLTFEDIDGDIGVEKNNLDISIVDNRDGVIDPVSFPILPELNDGQRGDLQVTILTTCCQFPDGVGLPCEVIPDFPNNQYTYDIFIKDDLGNRSNSITTAPITLLCR